MITTLKGQHAYARGIEAEYKAAAYMESKEYTVLYKRYKTSQGEIDLVAQKDDVIVFVEVKARTSQRDAIESITPRQARRIMVAASLFIANHPELDVDMRFDVITIDDAGHIEHLEHAWDAQLWECA